jgi:hypothetical protein
VSRRPGLASRCAGALLACAAPLLACAGGAGEAPAPAAQQTLSPERQQFERWKQDQPAADPRPDFERQAEAEAERRRREALEAGERLRPQAEEPEAGRGD